MGPLSEDEISKLPDKEYWAAHHSAVKLLKRKRNGEKLTELEHKTLEPWERIFEDSKKRGEEGLRMYTSAMEGRNKRAEELKQSSKPVDRMPWLEWLLAAIQIGCLLLLLFSGQCD